MPTSAQAGVYAALLHYFKVIDAMGGNPHDGKMVIDGMKQRPTDDPLFGVGSIQPNGRKILPGLPVRGQDNRRILKDPGTISR